VSERDELPAETSHDAHVSGETELEELGYEQELNDHPPRGRIHSTSGKWNSTNFAFPEFSEVPLQHYA
jgi:hypothetical protein